MVIDITKLDEYDVVIFGDNKCISENAICIPNEAKYICITNKENLLNLPNLSYLTNTNEIKKLKCPYLILFSYDNKKIEEWFSYCKKNEFACGYYRFYDDELLHGNKGINCKIFRDYEVTDYIDRFRNRIQLDMQCSTLSNIFVRVRYNGLHDNYLFIGNIKAKGILNIEFMGWNGKINIANGSTFENVFIQDGTNGLVEIGEDCMFSTKVELRQTDAHHIFELSSGRRINRGKNIKIGNHVWCGREVMILGGFLIGDNSIIGARAISSGQFGSNLIIAGNSAKVIREGIIWSRDGLDAYDRDYYTECIDKSADKYVGNC